MRVLFVIALAAACSTPAPAGPRWPQPKGRDADGGESLAPRAAARAIAAVVEEDHAAGRAEPDRPVAPAAPAAPAVERPASTPVEPASEEITATEEIVIEIED